MSELDTLSSQHTAQFFKGRGIQDGEFQLSYDDDGEGYYYLKRFGEVHHLNFCFTDVELIGEHSYELSDKGTGVFLNDIQNYELLTKALNTIIVSQQGFKE